MKTDNTILIRIVSKEGNTVEVYGYIRYKIKQNRHDPLGKSQLWIQVYDINQSSFTKVFWIVLKKSGIRADIQALWNAAYEKCDKPDSWGIEFVEE